MAPRMLGYLALIYAVVLLAGLKGAFTAFSTSGIEPKPVDFVDVAAFALTAAAFAVGGVGLWNRKPWSRPWVVGASTAKMLHVGAGIAMRTAPEMAPLGVLQVLIGLVLPVFFLVAVLRVRSGAPLPGTSSDVDAVRPQAPGGTEGAPVPASVPADGRDLAYRCFALLAAGLSAAAAVQAVNATGLVSDDALMAWALMLMVPLAIAAAAWIVIAIVATGLGLTRDPADRRLRALSVLLLLAVGTCFLAWPLVSVAVSLVFIAFALRWSWQWFSGTRSRTSA